MDTDRRARRPVESLLRLLSDDADDADSASARGTTDRAASVRVDLAGLRFGSWVVLRAGRMVAGKLHWWCRCGGCGVEREVRGGDLRGGRSRGCGCRGRAQEPAEILRALTVDTDRPTGDAHVLGSDDPAE